MGNKKKIERKAVVPLSAEEIAFINRRKVEVQDRLPSLLDYTPVHSTLLEGERIDEIYELFYSDKTFNFYGK